MSEKIETALTRLIGVLPLKAKQETCGAQIKKLHQAVLRSFVEQGRILTRQEMAGYVDDLEGAIDALKSNDMVVFSESGDPAGAYRFTMEAREHNVRINGHEVHAMCALDALAISPMFGMTSQISSRCRVTGEPVRIEQSGESIENVEEAGGVRFGIVWGAANACSCCADSLCMEMMFLKDSRVAETWLAQDPDNREVFTLEEAVEFGARFFVPLMS
jgi:mercuric reductase